jgi:zinc protease
VTADQAIAAVAKTFGALPKRKGTAEPAGTRVEHFPASATEPVVLHHAGTADQAIAELSWPTTDEHAAWVDIAPTVILADILRQRVMDRLRTAEGDLHAERRRRVLARFPGVGPHLAAGALQAGGRRQGLRRDRGDRRRLGEQAGLRRRAAARAPARHRDRAAPAGAARLLIGQLGGAQTNPDRLEYVRQTLPRLSAVTAADVQRVAKRWLKPDRAFRIEVMPAAGAASAKVAAG